MTPEHHPVFVYGTLRPGGSNHHWLGEGKLTLTPAVFTGGILVNKGPYPYLLEDEAGKVVGELVEVDAADWARVAAALDRLEGTDSARPVHDSNLYNRYLRPVKTDRGPVEAWVYIPPASRQDQLRQAFPLIESGDWFNR